MNKENIPVITDREKLYDKCENMEQLFDKYYLPLLDKHYSKTYELQQEIQSLKKENKILRENAEHNDKVVDKVNWENLKLENQQKKFIEYLENEKNIYPYDISDYTYEDIINAILSKYKEIIESGDYNVESER